MKTRIPPKIVVGKHSINVWSSHMGGSPRNKSWGVYLNNGRLGPSFKTKKLAYEFARNLRWCLGLAKKNVERRLAYEERERLERNEKRRARYARQKKLAS